MGRLDDWVFGCAVVLLVLFSLAVTGGFVWLCIEAAQWIGRQP